MQFFQYKGCPFHYRLMGPEDATLIVLTHGGMVDQRIWEPQIPALISRYRVLLWDVRGHGRSRPGGRVRTIPQVAEDLKALLDHLGYRQAILVGLSAGGWLVQEFAIRHPQNVTALVVVGQVCWTNLPLPIRQMISSWTVPLILLLMLLIPWSLILHNFMRAGAAEHYQPQTRAYIQEVFSEWSKGEFFSTYGVGVGVFVMNPHTFLMGRS
jgi:3-oxoadipate enol-lactonase